MMEINWKQDYQGDFICPKCEQSRLGLAGIQKGKRRFCCPVCKSTTLDSIQLNKRSIYLESRMRDENIDWEKDYQGEFICPECDTRGMSVRGVLNRTNKRMFSCPACKKIQKGSHNIRIIMIDDPLNPNTKWYTNHKIKGFICPECKTEDIYLKRIDKSKKKIFKCHTCQKHQSDSIIINNANLSHYSNSTPPVKLVKWEDERWDLRSINPNFDEQDQRISTANFTDIAPAWFKSQVKQYIWHLCKVENSMGKIHSELCNLRLLSRYLISENISGFDEINRSVILDYLSHVRKNSKAKLGGLRNFFTIGTLKNWFNIDRDIIRDADYPKQYRGNPDPISDRVKDQIEQNLHLLPDPIARMWLIGYFSAMRPSELALLKQNCLIQEGQHWKLVWQRKKTNDYHEIPISRTIAKVIQEQQDYIQNLWGNEWDYLFCHYHNLSRTDVSQSKLEPIKKVVQNHSSHPLLISIRTLLKSLSICDENGQPAKFQLKLLRPTRLTNLFEQGHDLFVVSAWAGHKNLYTTSTYYTQVSCELMEREAGHIQKALVNSNGHRVLYESFPKSFWENPTAHKLELGDTHINTPIYGYCGLPLDQDCHKFRACYTCQSFVATLEKLPQYIKNRDELRAKQAKAMTLGQEVLVEQFGRQAEQLDKIIASLQQEAA